MAGALLFATKAALSRSSHGHRSGGDDRAPVRILRLPAPGVRRHAVVSL